MMARRKGPRRWCMIGGVGQRSKRSSYSRLVTRTVDHDTSSYGRHASFQGEGGAVASAEPLVSASSKSRTTAPTTLIRDITMRRLRQATRQAYSRLLDLHYFFHRTCISPASFMPANIRKSTRVHKPSEKAKHGRRDSSGKGKSSKAREVRTPKTKKRKRAMSSEGVTESSKQSEEEDEETDEDTPHRRRKGKSRRSVTSGRSAASEVEEVAASAQDNDSIELLSVDTRHSSEYGDVSSHSMSIL
jgi:hypothetical protein